MDSENSAIIAKRNLCFLTALRTVSGEVRNEFSSEGAYIDLHYGNDVTGTKLVGQPDIGLCKVSIALADAGIELKQHFAYLPGQAAA